MTVFYSAPPLHHRVVPCEDRAVVLCLTSYVLDVFNLRVRPNRSMTPTDPTHPYSGGAKMRRGFIYSSKSSAASSWSFSRSCLNKERLITALLRQLSESAGLFLPPPLALAGDAKDQEAKGELSWEVNDDEEDKETKKKGYFSSISQQFISTGEAWMEQSERARERCCSKWSQGPAHNPGWRRAQRGGLFIISRK